MARIVGTSFAIVALVIAGAFAWAALTGSPPAVSRVPGGIGAGCIGTGYYPSPVPCTASRLHSLMGAIVHGQTITIDGRTYRAAHCQRERGHAPGQRSHWQVMCG
jgi:hypothetical protein